MSSSLPKYEDLKKLIRQADLTIKDVADVLNMRTTTLGSKLSGYAPLDKALYDKIVKLCNNQIKRNSSRSSLSSEYNQLVGEAGRNKPGLEYKYSASNENI